MTYSISNQTNVSTAKVHAIWFEKLARFLESDASHEIIYSQEFRLPNVNSDDINDRLHGLLELPLADLLGIQVSQLTLSPEQWAEAVKILRNASNVLAGNFNVHLTEADVFFDTSIENIENSFFDLCDELVSEAWYNAYPKMGMRYGTPKNYFSIIAGVHALSFHGYSLKVLKRPVNHAFYDAFLLKLSNDYLTKGSYIHELLVITTLDVLKGEHSKFRFRKSKLTSCICTDKTNFEDTEFVYIDVLNETIKGDTSSLFA